MYSDKQMPLFQKTILASVVPLLVLGAASQGHAQPMLEEVLVTATKRQESLQDVPIAVAALSGNELEDSGVDSQRALSMMVPNVAVNVNASFVAPYIRGVGTQYANPGLEPSVATYFNDVYISRPTAGFIAFSDVARVEVLKGPQGTLYGRNTTGGAIRVITNDPTEEFEGRAALTAGDYSTFGADGFLSGPITDTLKGRIAFDYVDRDDGTVDNVAGGPDLDDRNYWFLHGKLLWEPTDQLAVKLDGNVTYKRDHEGINFQPLFPGAPEQTAAALGGTVVRDDGKFGGNMPQNGNSPFLQRFHGWGNQLRIDYEFDDFTASSITGYQYIRFKGVADLDGTDLPFLNALTNEDKTEDWSQEFQMVSNTDGNWEWLLGLYYLRERATDDFGVSGTALDSSVFPGAFVGGIGDIKINSFAPYGQLAYNLTEQWQIMVGARYTDETKKVQNNFYVTAANENWYPTRPYLQTIPNPEQKFHFDKTTPKVQVTWRPADDQMYYLSYSEGIKSGGFNMPQNAPGPVTQVGNESIDSYEFGWKTQFDTLRFNGAIFHYDLSDLQLQVTNTSGGITSVRNAGKATVDGAEFDITWAATESLDLSGGLGYQDTEFDNFADGLFNPPCSADPTNSACVARGGLGLANAVGDLKGNSLPQAPEWSGNIRGTYTWGLGNNGDLAFTVLASYLDDFYWTSDNLYEEESKWLANANINWTSSDGSYMVNAYVTNLTDEEFFTHTAPLGDTGGWRVPGEPRMYGVRLAYNF